MRNRWIAVRVSLLGAAVVAASCSAPATAPGGGTAAAPTTAPAVAPSSAPSAAASSGAVASPAAASASPAVSSTSAPFTPPERSQVTINYATASGEDSLLLLASQAGIFQRYGLNVDVEYVESTAGTASVVSGESQFSLGEGAGTSQAIAQGANLAIIGVFDQTNPYAIIGGTGVVQPSDLKGKTFAISKIGDTSDVSAHIGLSSVGIQMGTDVTPIEVGNSPARFSALLAGQVGGAIEDALSYGPRAQQNGLHVLVDLQAQKIPYMASALIIRRDFGASNPNTVQDMLKALIDAVRYFQDPANMQASLQAIGQDLQLPADDPQVLSAYQAYHLRQVEDPTPSPEGEQTILSALQAIDPERFQGRTVDEFLDPSYMNALRQQGFVQGS